MFFALRAYFVNVTTLAQLHTTQKNFTDLHDSQKFFSGPIKMLEILWEKKGEKPHSSLQNYFKISKPSSFEIYGFSCFTAKNQIDPMVRDCDSHTGQNVHFNFLMRYVHII